MKLSLFHRAGLLALLLSFTSVGVVLAQAPAGTNGTTAPRPPASVLDNDEMIRLRDARQQVLSTNPDLKTEEDRLKQLHESAQAQNPPATPEQKTAMFAEWKAYQKKMRAAMLKDDPTLGPIFAKLDKARKTAASAPAAEATH
jgi:hypothetical protein